MTPKPLLDNLPALTLMAVFLVLCFSSIQNKEFTYDEVKHLKYGRNILKLKSDRIGFDDSKMPLSALNAAVERLGKSINPGSPFTFWNESKTRRKIFRALKRISIHLGNKYSTRYATILFSLGIAVVVYHWSRDLYGNAAAMLSTFLFCFSPNLIAHARLVTTDLFITGMVSLFFYLFWKFLKHPGHRQFKNWPFALPSAFALGVAQVAKYTAVFLYPIILLIVVLRYGNYLFRERRKGPLTRQVVLNPLKRFAVWAMLFGVIVVWVINSAYFFNGSFRPLQTYDFESRFLQNVQKSMTRARVDFVPVPLPLPYVQGLDRVKERTETGVGVERLYLFGETMETKDRVEGFPGYFLIACLFKVPLAIWALMLWALVSYLRRKNFSDFFDDEVFVVAPLLFFTVYFNFFFDVQIGIRFFLIVFPMVFVFCGSLLKGKQWRDISGRSRIALASLGITLVVSVMSYFPHFIPYFNELVWDRKMAYRLLADSNIDWGQNARLQSTYRKQHPEVEEGVESPQPGKFVVGINALVGVTFNSPEKYRWLRENFRPIDHIGYSYLIYEVTAEGLQRAGIPWER